MTFSMALRKGLFVRLFDMHVCTAAQHSAGNERHSTVRSRHLRKAHRKAHRTAHVSTQVWFKFKFKNLRGIGAGRTNAHSLKSRFVGMEEAAVSTESAAAKVDCCCEWQKQQRQQSYQVSCRGAVLLRWWVLGDCVSCCPSTTRIRSSQAQLADETDCRKESFGGSVEERALCCLEQRQCDTSKL
jgi:hypothetical protein